MSDLETCIIEIKKAIARIEEQTRTIFQNLHEYRDWSQKLHNEHFEAAKELGKQTAEVCRVFDVRVSRHDVDIAAIHDGLRKLEGVLEKLAESSARTRGIALGLGMAGGATVSILSLIIPILFR